MPDSPTTPVESQTQTPAPAPPAAPTAPKPFKAEPPQNRPNGIRHAPSKRSSKLWLWIVLLLVVAGGTYYFWPKGTASKTPNQPNKAGGRGGGGGVVPVVAAKSTKGNIGVYVTGLGSITPINTVTVKSRVDGQLMDVKYKEGDLVHQGDVLVQIDPRPYQAALLQAQGTLAKDQAALENAKIDLQRYTVLVQQQAAPEQQLATQKATVEQDEGTVKTDQGQVDAANVNVIYTKITAPITGVVGLRLVDPGNIVHASDTNGLLVITQIQPISAIFTISEDQLPAVLKKMRAGQKLEVDAFDREMKNMIAKGTLTTVDNQIDPTTGTLKLRATFDNADNSLFPNQFINARLLVEEKRGVTLAPTAAIQRNSNSTYVYVVNPTDSTANIRQVTVGTTEGDETEIAQGLVPGETLILTGVDKLQEGTKVNAQLPGQQQAAPTNNTQNNSGGKKGKKGK